LQLLSPNIFTLIYFRHGVPEVDHEELWSFRTWNEGRTTGQQVFINQIKNLKRIVGLQM
jgi:hypothetical protein